MYKFFLVLVIATIKSVFANDSFGQIYMLALA